MGESCAGGKAYLYLSNSSDLADGGFCCERGKFAFTLDVRKSDKSGALPVGLDPRSMDNLAAESLCTDHYIFGR
ncbi:hypothetical protein VN97_g539 [Penicillium thymicola]|uniref:Uncharacterized protein n=1 Tax=Penicillium thymicola TaxID=293382 RepID=A0AAI9TT89_PENTH|nr:hypothetical protein VN97_g539 [Penicillium thymicola]